MKKTISPRNCKTIEDVCNKRRDNFSTEKFWILADESSVTITEQKKGGEPNQSITIPKKDFDKLADWYYREQVIINRKK